MFLVVLGVLLCLGFVWICGISIVYCVVTFVISLWFYWFCGELVMFNWVYRFVVLGFWCGFGVLFYVNRASYTVDQFGVFACGWLCVLGLVFFLRDVSEGYRKDELVQAKAHEALWKEKWLGERENVRLLEAKRCPRAGGWLVREWPGYFLRDDSDLRRDGRGGVDEEAYSLFRLEPYGRVEVFVGPLGWALERAEKCVARGDDPEGVSTPEDDERYRGLLDTAGKVFSGGFSEGEARRIAENVAESIGGRVNSVSLVDGVVTANMSVQVDKPVDNIILNLGDDTHVGQLTREAFIEGCDLLKNAKPLPDLFSGVPMVDDLVKSEGIEPGEVVAYIKPEVGKTYQFESTVGPVVIDTRGVEVLGKMQEFIEVEKPTAYDSLIGDTGTTMVPVSSVDSQTFHGQMQRMSLKAMDDIMEEENKRVWGALLAASKKAMAEDDGPSVEELEAQTDCWAAMKESEGFHQEHHNLIPNRRYKFLSLPNGSKFRYDGLDTVFVKLSDFSQRGEAIGLVAKFEGFDIKKFLATGDYLDSSQVFCAAESVDVCESLVVTVLE